MMSSTPEFYTTMPVPYNTHVDQLFGMLCVFSFLMGSIGNSVALSQFLKKKKDVPTIIYIAAVVVDIIISILVLPIAVSLYADRRKVFFSSPIFCDVWAFFWTTLLRMSVFVVAVLSLSRAYSLAFPFSRVKKGVVIGILAAGLLGNALGTSIPFWFGNHHYYSRASPGCNVVDPVSHELASNMMTSLDWLGSVVPVVVILASFLVTIWKIKEKTVGVMRVEGRRMGGKRRATVTINIFTGTYLFFNLPAAIIMPIYSFNPHLLPWPDSVYLICYMFTMVVPLNSATNPLIYFWRMEHLRPAWFRRRGTCNSTARGLYSRDMGLSQPYLMSRQLTALTRGSLRPFSKSSRGNGQMANAIVTEDVAVEKQEKSPTMP